MTWWSLRGWGLMAMQLHDHSMVVAVDVGTTKVCVLIAELTNNRISQVIGIGRAPSDGLRRGVVVDIAKTVQSLKTAVAEAELMAGCRVSQVCVGISGAHIGALHSTGAVPLKAGLVRQRDIDDALAAARAVPLEHGQQILHVIPQFFILDGRDHVQDPLGMHGVKLEVAVHIVTGAVSSVQNLVSCCQMVGTGVEEVILEQLASAYAVLTGDERELGVGVLDIGGGTSDFAVYQQGAIRHTSVIPIAGAMVTSDIAIGLRLTLKDAERLKCQYASVLTDDLASDQLIEIERADGHREYIKCADMRAIVDARIDELLAILAETIMRNNLRERMPAGLVITGGGSLLRGLALRAQEVLHMPVRCGGPRPEGLAPESLLSPMYATAYGMLCYAVHARAQSHATVEGPLLSRIVTHMKSWVSDLMGQWEGV